MPKLSKINYVRAVLQTVGMYIIVVQIHTSVPLQNLAFDFLLGKVPRGKEAHLYTLTRIIERTEFSI